MKIKVHCEILIKYNFKLLNEVYKNIGNFVWFSFLKVPNETHLIHVLVLPLATQLKGCNILLNIVHIHIQIYDQITVYMSRIFFIL